MELPNNCKETYLDGITDIYAYPVSDCHFPMPPCVAQILSMDKCVIPEASTLHISLNDEQMIVADDITAKVTPDIASSGTIFTHEMSANIGEGIENVREAYKIMREKDFYVVLHNINGGIYLCYTLPGTFAIKYSTSTNSTNTQNSVSISLKSMSDIIGISLKE